jgi:hypothetical protein
MAVWLAERCKVGPSFSANSTALANDWNRFRQQRGEQPERGKDIAPRLRLKGFKDRKSNGLTVWSGLRLKGSWGSYREAD